MEDLRVCYEHGRDKSNNARVSIEHKEPLVTEISIIDLKHAENSHRPYFRLPGMKSTNCITLITKSHLQSNWKLYKNVLPEVAVDRSQDITSQICEGEDNKIVTAKMAGPGSKRKPLKTDEDGDPKTIASHFKARMKFIKNDTLENYLKYELKVSI